MRALPGLSLSEESMEVSDCWPQKKAERNDAYNEQPDAKCQAVQEEAY